MRSVDEPEKFRGLGQKVEKPKPAPAPAPKPQGAYGLVTDPTTGRMRTTQDNLPKLTLEDAIANWREHYAAEALLDFLP